MPFTLAHAAAVLPVRRVGFVTSAFVVGTFGPDFEYFLRLAPHSRFGHQWPGVMFFTVPACLLALWLFHVLIKRPAVALLPSAVERGVAPYLTDFRFGGIGRFGLILVSLSAGIATHLVWDLFTHPHTWATRNWPVLLERIGVPVLGAVPLYKVLQHTITAVGMAALTLWFLGWLRAERPMVEAKAGGLGATHKLAIVSSMIAIAAVGAAVRTFALLPSLTTTRAAASFVVVLGVSSIAFFSMSLLAYAIWWTWVGQRQVRDGATSSEGAGA